LETEPAANEITFANRLSKRPICPLKPGFTVSSHENYSFDEMEIPP